MDDPGFDSWQIFLSFPKIHTCSGVHPASYSMGTRNKTAEVKKLITHLHPIPVPRMRIRGAIPLPSSMPYGMYRTITLLTVPIILGYYCT